MDEHAGSRRNCVIPLTRAILSTLETSFIFKCYTNLRLYLIPIDPTFLSAFVVVSVVYFTVANGLVFFAPTRKILMATY